jgi:hypothetical protein
MRSNSPDPISAAILQVLSEAFPDLNEKITYVDDFLKVEWPSQNPRVSENLVLSTENDPALFWFHGYFYDFPIMKWITSNGLKRDITDEEIAANIASFLRDFFDEKIGCGIEIVDEEKCGGGPVWYDTEFPEGFDATGYDIWWERPTVIVRSWKGNRDMR